MRLQHDLLDPVGLRRVEPGLRQQPTAQPFARVGLGVRRHQVVDVVHQGRRLDQEAVGTARLRELTRLPGDELDVVPAVERHLGRILPVQRPQQLPQTREHRRTL